MADRYTSSISPSITPEPGLPWPELQLPSPPSTQPSKRKRDTSPHAPALTTFNPVDGERHTSPLSLGPPRKRQSAAMKKDECQSCCIDVPANQFPKTPHKKATSSCRACLSCWSQHLHSQLEGVKWDQLSCVGCDTILEMSEIKHIQSRFKRKDKIEPKIQEKATMDLLRSMPEFVPCPSSTCKDGAFMADGNLFTCQTCKFRYCFDCNVPFHEEERCQEFQDRIKEDERKTLEVAKSLDLLKMITKPCPKCQSPIQKISGCDHMSCTKCNHQFCWLCFAKWSDIIRDGNSMHTKTCLYYRAWNPPPPVAAPRRRRR